MGEFVGITHYLTSFTTCVEIAINLNEMHCCHVEIYSLCIHSSQSISELKPQVDDLSRSSNSIYTYITKVSDSLTERQRVVNGEKTTSWLLFH